MECDLRIANLEDADLRGARLMGANLFKARLARADLRKAFLGMTSLRQADLHAAKLGCADLSEADLHSTDCREADLTGAVLFDCTLRFTDLTKATLIGANLSGARLIGTILEGANLSKCRVYSTAVWDIQVNGALQHDLVISRDRYYWELEGPPLVTLDNIELAQFVYLLLNNRKVREVIDTVTSKVVLILGRFTEERLAVLNQIREALRNSDLVPIIYDFPKPANKDLTGTVETLARMALFVIADLTYPSSIPHEIATIVPYLRTTPIIPIRLKGSDGYTMFDDFERAYKDWVLPKYEYESKDALIAALSDKVIGRAKKRAEDLRRQ